LSETSIVSIVDDDQSIRVSVGALVRSLGYAAHAFASAEEFLNSAEAEATDCLITDIQMPGMSGVELQQALALKGRQLPIIFITAFPKERITRQVIAAGAICLLSKPFDGGALVSCIETALSSRG
jgi:FixJ family two-component response regulator